MLCTHKTTILCQFGLFFVISLPNHISINSQPFLVGIVSNSRNSVLSLFKTKISVQNKQFQNPKQFHFNFKLIQDSFSILHQSQIQINITESNHLCDLWEHTIVKVFKHDSKSKLGLMLKQWIIFNKLEHFNSVLNHSIDDFTPSGNLIYMNQHGEVLHHTPLQEVFNLRCYIQHLMDESEDETQNPLSHENWMKKNNWKFIKYVIHHRHPMTPEQLKQKPFESNFKNQHEKVDTEKGESIEEEEKSTTSSDKPEQDFKSDITTDDEEEINTTETHQVHNVLNETIHDEDNSSEAEDDTSEDENVTEMQTYGNISGFVQTNFFI